MERPPLHRVVGPVFIGLLGVAYYFGVYIPDGRHERLVVGVLSARHHMVQRHAIRDTWWQRLQLMGARGVFVIGDTPCQLADHCRRDTYSCDLWQPALNVTTGEQTLQFGLAAKDAPAAAGVAFTVLHAVVVRRVTSPAVLEMADGRPVAEAGPDGALTAHLLPAGFTGRLRLTEAGRRAAGRRCRRSLPPADTALLVTSLLTSDGRHVLPGAEPLCWPPALVFTVEDPAGLRKHLDGRPDTCRQRRDDVTDSQLTEEAARYGDLLLLPGVDVYSRLPDKLIGFYSWVAAHSSADYVVKCDDDVILDVDRILRNIPKDTTGSGIWWGHFRYNWPTDRYGKWAEHQYQADVYPPFACGTASLMSVSVARWLARNSAHLTRFQGEDVSVGVWLAGHTVRRVSDAGWWCGSADDPVTAGYSRGQLSPTQLRHLWRCLRRTGKLELCPSGG